MAWTGDFAVLDGGIVEWGVIMGASIFECVERASNARHAHPVTIHIRFES
jgi:hypothetical protein